MSSELDQEILAHVATTVARSATRKQMTGYFWMANDRGQRTRFDYAKLTDAQVGWPWASLQNLDGLLHTHTHVGRIACLMFHTINSLRFEVCFSRIRTGLILVSSRTEALPRTPCDFSQAGGSTTTFPMQ